MDSKLASQAFQSVWDAIEDSIETADEFKRRSALMIALTEHIREQAWSRAVAARQLGVSEVRLAELLRGKIDAFGLDVLVAMARSVGLKKDPVDRAIRLDESPSE